MPPLSHDSSGRCDRRRPPSSRSFHWLCFVLSVDSIPYPSSKMEAPYPYPNSNADIISKLKLEKHFEGGYFAQTIAVGSTPGATSSPTDRVQTASGDGTGWYGGAQAGPSTTVDATQIYYLLTPDSYRGKMHMNLHSVSHTSAALIRPSTCTIPGELCTPSFDPRLAPRTSPTSDGSSWAPTRSETRCSNSSSPGDGGRRARYPRRTWCS